MNTTLEQTRNSFCQAHQRYLVTGLAGLSIVVLGSALWPLNRPIQLLVNNQLLVNKTYS